MNHRQVQHSLAYVLGALFIFRLAGCDADVPVVYDNRFDPESPNYIAPRPSAPFRLNATALADSGVALVWSDSNMVADQFIIEARVGTPGAYAVIGSTTGGVTQFFDRTPLHSGTQYFYRVGTRRKSVPSNYSNEVVVAVTLAEPGRPAVTVISSRSFEISWTMPRGFQTGVRLERSVNDRAFALVAALPVETRSFVDNDIDTLNSYVYRVRSVSAFNESGYSPLTSVYFTVVGAHVINSVTLVRPVHSIVFSRDGTMFAAAGMSWALRVWNSADCALVRDFDRARTHYGSLGWPFQVAFSEDNELVGADADGEFNARVDIWRVTDGALAATVHGPYSARSIAISPDKRSVVTGDHFGTVSQWDMAGDSLLRSTQAFPGNVAVVHLSFTPFSGRLVVGGSGLELWNAQDLSPLKSLSSAIEEYFSVSHDEKYFAARGEVRSLVDGSLVKAFPGFPAVSVLSNDNRFLIGQDRATLLVGQCVDGSIRFSRSLPMPDIYTYPAVASSPNGHRFLAAGPATGEIDLWGLDFAWVSN